MSERINYDEILRDDELADIQRWVEEAGDDEWDEFRIDVSWVRKLLATIDAQRKLSPPKGSKVLVPKSPDDVSPLTPVFVEARLKHGELKPVEWPDVYVEWSPE